jgi:DNA-binding response OmpR family regulator
MTKDELEALRKRVEVLEQEKHDIKVALAPQLRFPRTWGLNRGEQSLLAALYSAPDGFRTKEALSLAINLWGKERRGDPTILLRVTMYSLRKKLSLEGIKIETRWCEGYVLPPESKELITSLCISSVA